MQISYFYVIESKVKKKMSRKIVVLILWNEYDGLYKIIDNAVPCNMAKAVATAVSEFLNS